MFIFVQTFYLDRFSHFLIKYLITNNADQYTNSYTNAIMLLALKHNLL